HGGNKEQGYQGSLERGGRSYALTFLQVRNRSGCRRCRRPSGVQLQLHPASAQTDEHIAQRPPNIQQPSCGIEIVQFLVIIDAICDHNRDESKGEEKHYWTHLTVLAASRQQ